MTVMEGAEAVRERYAKSMSDHPNRHYDIPNRIALGPYVIDKERVTGFARRRASAALLRVGSSSKSMPTESPLVGWRHRQKGSDSATRLE